MCSDPHGEFTGLNCLIERESVEATAAAFGLSVEETESTLAKSRQLLHERRAQRPRPHLDDKVSSLHISAPTSSGLCQILYSGTALLCSGPADFPDIPASSLSSHIHTFGHSQTKLSHVHNFIDRMCGWLALMACFDVCNVFNVLQPSEER